jgi:hypothetical protein
MKVPDIKAVFEKLNIDVNSLGDENIRQAIVLLYNLIEDLSATIRELQEENQRLRACLKNTKADCLILRTGYSKESLLFFSYILFPTKFPY